MLEEDFDFIDYENALKAKPDYILDQCYNFITNLLEDNIIRLYTCIDSFLFQDHYCPLKIFSIFK